MMILIGMVLLVLSLLRRNERSMTKSVLTFSNDTCNYLAMAGYTAIAIGLLSRIVT